MRTVVAGHRSRGAHPLRRAIRRARQSLPAPGRPARRGLDRERAAALPVARLRLLPADRHRRPSFGDEVTDVTRSRSATTGSTSASSPSRPHARTVSDVMAETMVAWGVRHVFGMVGHSNLGLADAIRRQEEAGELEYIGIRHEGAAAFAASAYGKLTGRPAACLTIAGPGRHQPADRALGRQGRPRAGARPDRPGRHRRSSGPGAFQEVDLAGGVRAGRGLEPDRAARAPTTPS